MGSFRCAVDEAIFFSDPFSVMHTDVTDVTDVTFVSKLKKGPGKSHSGNT